MPNAYTVNGDRHPATYMQDMAQSKRWIPIFFQSVYANLTITCNVGMKDFCQKVT